MYANINNEKDLVLFIGMLLTWFQKKHKIRIGHKCEFTTSFAVKALIFKNVKFKNLTIYVQIH